MKKIIYLLLIVIIIILASLTACTNDEGGEDIDVITPADSTAARLQK